MVLYKYILLVIGAVFRYSILLIAISAGIVLNTSCSTEKLEKVLHPIVEAPASTIERVVKGHEQIASVQAILRIALKNNDDTYDAYDIWAYTVFNKKPPFPIYQEIDLKKDDMGNIIITSERKAFDVFKSRDYYYALELKYFDVNGLLINHQFSAYDKEDLENSTLIYHQHFFTIQNYDLRGEQLTYPMTLDSTYYDRFIFKTDNQGNKIKSTKTSSPNVFIPKGHVGYDNIRYNSDMAMKAIEKTHTLEATSIYRDENTGLEYELYKANTPTELNEITPEVFTYYYRDTDPIEKYLGDAIYREDDLGRMRAGAPVLRLRQGRSLLPGQPLDALGFKGILQFHHANMLFQMRVCIAHILTSSGKYDIYYRYGGLHEHNELSPAWNSYDIDYPIPVRVIADLDGSKEKAIQDILKFYPEADPVQLDYMFWSSNYEFFDRKPYVLF